MNKLRSVAATSLYKLVSLPQPLFLPGLEIKNGCRCHDFGNVVVVKVMSSGAASATECLPPGGLTKMTHPTVENRRNFATQTRTRNSQNSQANKKKRTCEPLQVKLAPAPRKTHKQNKRTCEPVATRTQKAKTGPMPNKDFLQELLFFGQSPGSRATFFQRWLPPFIDRGWTS
ncbi:MAG: hypothetical protein BJ554DRAFT_3641, partial [Olpidium bornovanus]